MRSLLLLPAIIFVGSSLHQSFPFFQNQTKIIADSGIINHVLDGSTDEWSPEKFETDKETNIKYAVDNDADNLYIAMYVPDFRMQMKMMRQGMNLYIDLKGKKKENRGIEFPVKRDFTDYSGGFSNQQGNQSGQTDNDRQEGFDKKAMRSSMALSLIFMKMFGFGEDEPKNQGLLTDGSANISFQWDSSDVMHIEYQVPLKLLDESVASLNQKNISIGWKVNGIEAPSSSSSTSSSFGGASGGGGRSGGGRSSGSTFGGGSTTSSQNFSQSGREKMMEAEDFWTKYTIAIPASK